MEIFSIGIATEWLVIPQIKDDFLHPVVISATNNLTIYTDPFAQPTTPEEGSTVGYIAISGNGLRRKIENEGSIDFGKKFKQVLGKPFQKIQIV